VKDETSHFTLAEFLATSCSLLPESAPVVPGEAKNLQSEKQAPFPDEKIPKSDMTREKYGRK
jgi:hypothetical protein